MKQFVVIGLGRFGSNLAVALSKLGNQVLAIDIDRKKVEAVKDYITEAVIADALDMRTLKEFIDNKVDTVIVAIASDVGTSTLVVLYLKDLGVKHIVGKVRNEDHAKILTALGVNEVIYPESDIAARLAENLTISNLIAHIPLAPEYSIVEIITPETFVGKTLRELDLRKKFGFSVIGIKDVLLDKIDINPSPDTIFMPDSVMLILCKTEEFPHFKFE
ncbi:MAG: TrkA family potassium uptake protein [Ignavibacteria bacterium]|nr:TrkA family potassium uptake protein [Ignavibacteria bacterium]